jgi:hypothetical protein
MNEIKKESLLKIEVVTMSKRIFDQLEELGGNNAINFLDGEYSDEIGWIAADILEYFVFRKKSGQIIKVRFNDVWFWQADLLKKKSLNGLPENYRDQVNAWLEKQKERVGQVFLK